MIELAFLKLPSYEVIVTAAVGIGFTFFTAWKKLKEIREQKASKKHTQPDHGDIMGMIARERELAVEQRDRAQALSEELKAANQLLREQMREFEREVDDLKSKLSLLSELNRRLSASLDLAQNEITRISATLSQIPVTHSEP